MAISQLLALEVPAVFPAHPLGDEFVFGRDFECSFAEEALGAEPDAGRLRRRRLTTSRRQCTAKQHQTTHAAPSRPIGTSVRG
jgi:hypothetical protein